jgi:hypothetical protein
VCGATGVHRSGFWRACWRAGRPGHHPGVGDRQSARRGGSSEFQGRLLAGPTDTSGETGCRIVPAAADTDNHDEWVPTEVDVQHDKIRAIKLMVAIVLGITSAAGPVGAGLAGFAGPFFEKIVNKLQGRRVRNATETALDAAQISGLTPEEFLDKAVSDDHRHELLARALIIAQDTALRSKRRALGYSVAAGVMGDDAKIDEELLFMRAVADVDEWHIRLLGRMLSHPPAGFGGWTADQLEMADPGLAGGVLALLGTLELHGLVATAISNRAIPSAVGSTTHYSVTAAARHFLGRLEADAETLATE